MFGAVLSSYYHHHHVCLYSSTDMLVSAKAIALLCVLHCISSGFSIETMTTHLGTKEVMKVSADVSKAVTSSGQSHTPTTHATVNATAHPTVNATEHTTVNATEHAIVNATVHTNGTTNTPNHHNGSSEVTTPSDLHLNGTLNATGSSSHVFVTTTDSPDDGNTTDCSGKLRMLAVLPGQGWDNLESVTKGQIFMKNYSMCTLTTDGALVIPDGMFPAPLFETTVDPTAEIFTKWDEYYPLSAKSVTKDESNPDYAAVSGSFSQYYQHVKKVQVTENGVTVRVQLKSKLYEIAVPTENVPLTDDFRDAMLKLENAVYDNDDSLTQYYADALVQQYGTHFVNGIIAGGMIVVESSVKADFLDVSEVFDFSKLSTVAKMNFLEFYNMTASNDIVDPSLKDILDKYRKSTIDTEAKTHGGEFEIPFNFNQWQKSVHSSPAILDRTGVFLDEVVNEQNFPHIPPPFVTQMKKEVKNAISRYYIRNTHRGCTDKDAPNFAFFANKEDGTCHIPSTNYTFGGVFQKCKQSSHKLGDLCLDLELEVRNPLTGQLSCPQGYDKIPLHSHVLYKDNCPPGCLDDDKCTKKCTKEKFQFVKITYTTYWCAALDELPQNSGYLFGGLYSSKAVNMVTGRFDCPSSYIPLKIAQDLRICVSNDNGQHVLSEAVAFGGFFSCVFGNPLVLPMNQRRQSDWPMRCPLDYSRQTAIVDGVCPISYCVSPGEYNITVLPLIRPPYTKKPDAINIHVLVFRDGNNGDVWYRKNETQSWKKATTEQDLLDAGLEGLLHMLKSENGTAGNATKAAYTRTYRHEETTKGKGGLGGGVIAAIVIVATLGVLAVVGFSGYAYKKKKEQRERSDSKAQLTRNDSVQQERSDSIASQPHQPTDESFDSPA